MEIEMGLRNNIRKNESVSQEQQLACRLNAAHKKLECVEEALNKASLSFMAQIHDLQVDKQHLRAQLELETNKQAELKEQILNLKSKLVCNIADGNTEKETVEELKRKLEWQEKQYENETSYLKSQVNVALKENQELSRLLEYSENKVTHLLKLMQTQRSLFTNKEPQEKQCEDVATKQFYEQIAMLRQDMGVLKQRMKTSSLSQPKKDKACSTAVSQVCVTVKANDPLKFPPLATALRHDRIQALKFCENQQTQTSYPRSVDHGIQVSTCELTDDPMITFPTYERWKAPCLPPAGFENLNCALNPIMQTALTPVSYRSEGEIHYEESLPSSPPPLTARFKPFVPLGTLFFVQNRQ